MEFSSERASQQQNPEGGRERNERPSHQTDGESRTYSPQMRSVEDQRKTVEDQTKRRSDAEHPHGILRAECHSTIPDDDKLSTSQTSAGTKYTSEICSSPNSLDNPNRRPSAVQSIRTITMPGDADALDPPDGGWGWVVCATAMLTSGTITGFLNTLSLVYVAILRRFSSDDPNIATKTSHVVSMVVFVAYLMCSVGGVLGDIFGIRQVAFAGGFLAFVGALSSAFVTDLMLLYLTFGVLLGVGFAFCLSQSLVIVSHYFKKRIGLVYSLMSFGGASFAVMFSLTMPWIFDNFGLKRMLFCLSGLNALLMVYALTWKPLMTRQSTKKAKQVADVARKESLKSLGTPTPVRTKTVGDASCGRKGGNDITSTLITTSTQKKDNPIENTVSFPTEEAEDSVKNISSVSGEKILDRNASCISGQDLKDKNDAHAQTEERQWDKNERCCCGLVKRKIWRNTSYVIWTVGSMIGTSGFLVGLTHMVKFAIDEFPDSDSKFLPLTYGVTMAVIRLLFGSIADKPIVMKLYIPIHQAVFVAMGTITMCLPSVESFEVVLIFAMMMGVCDGIFFLLLGPITVHLVGAENSSQAVGFYFGLIAFPLSAGPSLAGFMYDRYGSYDVAFRVLGVPCIVGALLMTLIPFAGKENKIVDFADERHT